MGCPRQCPCSEEIDAEIYIQVQYGICNLFPDGSAIIIMCECGVAGGREEEEEEREAQMWQNVNNGEI